MRKHWTQKLTELHACREAIDWAERYESLERAWKVCERGDWMLWLLGKTSGKPDSLSRRKLVGVTAECAELALPIFEKNYPNEKYVRNCIELCKRYSAGDTEVNLNDLRKTAASAAAYADAAAAAAAAYAYAAYAAADAAAAAAYAAADAAYAAYAAAAAAYAAAADAAAAKSKIFKRCSDIVRNAYPKPPKI